MGGHRAAPETPTGGRRAMPETTTGRRAAPEPAWGGDGAANQAAAEQFWPSQGQSWDPAAQGTPGRSSIDPVRPGTGSNFPPAGGSGPAAGNLPDDPPTRGRRRAPEPDEPPTGSRRSPEYSARASVAVPAAAAAPPTMPPPLPPPPMPPAMLPPLSPPPAGPTGVARPPAGPAAPNTPHRASVPVPAAPELPKPAAPELPIDTAAPMPPAPPGRPAGTARVGSTGTARVPAGTARVPVDPTTSTGFPASPDELWSPSDSGSVRRRNWEERALQDPSRRLPGTGPVGPPGTSTGGVAARPAAPAKTIDGSAGHSRRWLTILSIVGVIVVLAACGLGGYFMISGDKARPATPSSAKTSAVKARDISTRDVDPAPLTEQEVFPAAQITAGTATYQVLKTQSGDCPSAATDDIAKLLGQLGCSQVVRGTLKSQDGQFLITAGIFNLKDEASANQAYEQIKPALDAQKGRFTGLPAGDGTEAIVRAPTTLGWHPRGHFLAYCIVARADGKPIDANDAGSKQVISDLVEAHLRDTVIGARAVVSPAPSAKPGG